MSACACEGVGRQAKGINGARGADARKPVHAGPDVEGILVKGIRGCGGAAFDGHPREAIAQEREGMARLAHHCGVLVRIG